ncbi:hypothetical protein B0H17DRAFT_179754 [Mycena rosella]|uniref:C3H1-type domain-containing protein n=1 Tax=Mycena rosella TaxID=1033263 RepID=A0AAD7D0L6_MYCRO|nr:hypothetical protein B0H17DRAFT_179754 [Mycena rosella]
MSFPAYPFHPHPYAAYGPPCNDSGCVHSRTCPAFHQSAFHSPAANPYLNIPFADRGSIYIDPVPPASPVNIPCLFFQRNRCSNGDKCRFSHSVSIPSDMRSNMSQSLRCKFFLEGSCRNGESCLFLHDTAYDTAPQPASSTPDDDHEPLVEPISSETPPLVSEMDAHETDPEGAAVSPHTGQPPTGQASPNEALPPLESSFPVASVVFAEAAVFEPCTFHTTGRCVRGDSCVVRHPEPVGPVYSPIPSVSPLIADLKGDDGDWIQFSDENIARAANPAYDGIPSCSFFAKGLCNMGDRCRFVHDFVHNSDSRTTPRTLRPCKYFADGACAKGLMCPFLHDVPVHNAMSDSAVDELRRPCRYYSQGKCRKGDKCRFQHDSAGDPIPNPSPQPSDEQVTNRLVGTDDNPAWGTDQQESKWIEDEPPSKSLDENSYSGGTTSAENMEWVDQQSASKWTEEDPPKPLDENPYGGGTASSWFQDTEENTEWEGNKWTESAPVDDNSGPGWLHETDHNPAWSTDNEDASKWTTDRPPRTRDPHPSYTASFPPEDPGAEESWDAPWPDAVPDVKPARKARCKYFGQGYCTMGDSCRFLHVKEKASQQRDGDLIDQDAMHDAGGSPQYPTDQLATLLPGPAIEPDFPPQSIYGCMVRFGAGAIPEQVVTPFESQGVILVNYPPGMAHDDLLQLAEPYGVVKNTTFRLLPGGIQAHIEFEEVSQAANAAVNLNGFTIDQLVLRARLDSVGSVGGTVQDPEMERQIKLVWDAPSVSGWAFYPNVRLAKDESARLNGLLYAERKITAEYRTPSQKHSVPVRLAGLPLHVDRDSLHVFCVGSSSVSLNRPTYSESPNEHILACLAEFGLVTSFEVLPTDSSHLKITAFATFNTGRAAANAIRTLKGTPHDFLGKGCISAQPVFHSKYNCANCPFAQIRDDLDRLRDLCADTACTIQYYDDPPCVHVYGRRAKEMAPVKKTVEALLFGFELACWDPYFDTSSGQEALKRINTADTSFYIRRDPNQVLRVWGNRDKGEKQIIRLLTRVQAKRHHLRLNQDSLPVILNGGLQSLQDAFGASKIVLDIPSRSITVLGDIKTEAESHLQVLTSEYSRGAGNCCLCFSDAQHVQLSCTHMYCSACLKLLLRPIPGHFTTPRCIAEMGPDHPISQCLTAIPAHLIRSHLFDPEQTQQLFESALLDFVWSDSENDFRFCVSGCRVLYRKGAPGAEFTCPECNQNLCASCTTPTHHGLTCVEYQEISGAAVL